MRILYVTCSPLPNRRANAVQMARLSSGFAEAGHTTVLCVLGNSASPEEIRRAYGLVPELTILRFPGVGLAGRRGVLGLVGEVIYLTCVRLFALWFRPDRVVTRRSLAAVCFRNVIYNRHEVAHVLTFLERRAVAHARRVVATNAYIAHSLVEQGVPEKKIRVVSNGVDLAAIDVARAKRADARTVLRERFSLSSHVRWVALYTGSFVEHKGVGTLIEAALHLSPDMAIVAVGCRADECAQWRARVQHPNVFLAERVEPSEVPELLVGADVVVLPNLLTDDPASHDTSPIKLFEYLASGTPVVVSDIPTVREVVDETCALLVPPGDPKKLADALWYSVSHEEEMRVRTERARELSRSFSWRSRAEAFIEG